MTDSERPTVKLTESGRLWLGYSTILFGAMGLFLPWMVLSGARDEHDTAVRQQSWVPGSCVVVSSRTIQEQVNDSNERVLIVDFTMTTQGQTYEGLSYKYPHYASNARATPGSAIDCWHDPEYPQSVTLFRKSAPTEDRPGPGFLHIFFTALGALVVAFGVWTLKTKKQLYVG